MHVTEVEEFKDCGNGIFWPLRGYSRTRLPGATTGLEVSVQHTLHSINQPLAEEEFEIHFPDWLRVLDKSSGKVIIWGPEDKPRMTFASVAEYNQWYKPRMKDPFQGTDSPSARTRLLMLIGNSVFVGLVIIFLIIRRSKRARMAAGMSSTVEDSQADARMKP